MAHFFNASFPDVGVLPHMEHMGVMQELDVCHLISIVCCYLLILLTFVLPQMAEMMSMKASACTVNTMDKETYISNEYDTHLANPKIKRKAEE